MGKVTSMKTKRPSTHPTKSKFAVVPDIGLKVHRTVKTSFSAFNQTFTFYCQNRSAANIATSCLTYYHPMWDGRLTDGIDRSDVVIDVGAHMGFFAIPVSTQVEKVIAYEPSPANFALLLRNIDKNSTYNVLASNRAVGDIDGPVSLNLGVQGTTGHSIVYKKRGGIKLEVISQSITQVLRKYKPSVLKLDCEGAEWLILDRNNLSSFSKVRLMVVELHRVRQHNLPGLLKDLHHAGFKTHAKSNSWFTKLIAYR